MAEATTLRAPPPAPRGEGSIYQTAARPMASGRSSSTDPDTGRAFRRVVSGRSQAEARDRLNAISARTWNRALSPRGSRGRSATTRRHGSPALRARVRARPGATTRVRTPGSACLPAVGVGRSSPRPDATVGRADDGRDRRPRALGHTATGARGTLRMMLRDAERDGLVAATSPRSLDLRGPNATNSGSLPRRRRGGSSTRRPTTTRPAVRPRRAHWDASGRDPRSPLDPTRSRRSPPTLMIRRPTREPAAGATRTAEVKTSQKPADRRSPGGCDRPPSGDNGAHSRRRASGWRPVAGTPSRLVFTDALGRRLNGLARSRHRSGGARPPRPPPCPVPRSPPRRRVA